MRCTLFPANFGQAQIEPEECQEKCSKQFHIESMLNGHSILIVSVITFSAIKLLSKDNGVVSLENCCVQLHSAPLLYNQVMDLRLWNAGY